MSIEIEKLVVALKATTPKAELRILRNPGPSGQDALCVGRDYLLEVVRLLRDQHDFDFLSNVTGVDWPDTGVAAKVATPDEAGDPPESEVSENGCLEAVYHLYSTRKRIGPLVLKCRTADRTNEVSIPSVVSVYRSAEFQEREAYDLYGIVFTGHPDLRRILMWDEFEDHPMRKDYVAPDDYEYEPTPHDDVLEKAKGHYPSPQ